MNTASFKDLENLGVPDFAINHFEKRGIKNLNPAQIKAVSQGLLDCKNMLICTPTGSGKTAMATLAISKKLTASKGAKALYLVPLKALASEKFREYTELLKGSGLRASISTGDLDEKDDWLADYDVLILTVEKMDSLLRHSTPWIGSISIVIVDEIHMLNDAERGPTLEILLTMLKKLLKNAQVIGLSATIGNARELAQWLDAELVVDDWRPVKLHKGIYLDGEVHFY